MAYASGLSHLPGSDCSAPTLKNQSLLVTLNIPFATIKLTKKE